MIGAFLSNDCLRENVIDLSKFDDSEKLNLDAFSGSGTRLAELTMHGDSSMDFARDWDSHRRANLAMSILQARLLTIRYSKKANTRNADRFTASMYRCINEIYHPIFSNMTYRKTTKGGALSCQCHGGAIQQLSATLARFPLSAEESSAAIANWWNQSCEDKTNLSLAWLQEDHLIPIYKLVPDETKRAEVQRAVKAYIHSHQLN